MALSKDEKKRRCIGCKNNRYNQIKGFQEGPNDVPVSGEGCFNLDTARACNKEFNLGYDHTTLITKTLSCWYSASTGYGTETKRRH